jgi:hypothetical protein
VGAPIYRMSRKLALITVAPQARIRSCRFSHCSRHRTKEEQRIRPVNWHGRAPEAWRGGSLRQCSATSGRTSDYDPARLILYCSPPPSCRPVVQRGHHPRAMFPRQIGYPLSFRGQVRGTLEFPSVFFVNGSMRAASFPAGPVSSLSVYSSRGSSRQTSSIRPTCGKLHAF